MKILLTGANGQVGYELKKLLKNKYELLALDRSALDITHEEDVIQVVNNFKPDIIINTAAYTSVDSAEDKEKLAFLINSDGPEYLAKAANRVDAALIHISTDYVFEGNKSGLYNEKDRVNPQSVYGKSKLLGENAVINHCHKHIVLRTAWVFGGHGNNFVKTMLKLAKNRDTLSIIDDQVGGPTYAGDIAKTIVLIVEKIEMDAPINWGIFHYSGLPYVSWFEFAKNIFAKAKDEFLLDSIPKLIPITAKEFPLPAKRPVNSKLNCDAIYNEFGVVPSDWKGELENIKNYN